MKVLRYTIILYFLVLAVPWQAEAQEGIYVNQKYGFSITPPKSWVKILEKDKTKVFSISFTPSQEADFPVFGIMVKPPYPAAKDPLDFASQVLSHWKTSESRYEIAEAPRELEIGGINGARFQWDKPAWDEINKKEFWVRILTVYFRKGRGGRIFEISLFSRRDDFEKDYRNVEVAINSFKFIENTLAESSPQKYVNEQDKFEITIPHGWFKHENNGHITLTKQSTQELTIPVLGVVTDTAPSNMQTALEFTKSALVQYQLSAEQQKNTFRIIEPPHEIEINEIKGARFIFERMGQGVAMKSIDSKFMRANFVVSLQGMDYSETFDESLKDFEEATQSFRWK